MMRAEGGVQVIQAGEHRGGQQQQRAGRRGVAFGSRSRLGQKSDSAGLRQTEPREMRRRARWQRASESKRKSKARSNKESPSD